MWDRSSRRGNLTLAAAAKVIAQNEAMIRKFMEVPWRQNSQSSRCVNADSSRKG
jgi:hypothetical protein